MAKEFNVRFPKPAGSVASPRYRVNDPIRKDKRRHHVMGNALRPQRCEDREAPIGGFAKDSVKPLSGFDDVLNGATPVIRRILDTVRRRSDLGILSTAPDTRYSPEFWMQRTNMHCGAAYRRPEHGELLAEHLEKRTCIGRKTSLLA